MQRFPQKLHLAFLVAEGIFTMCLKHGTEAPPLSTPSPPKFVTWNNFQPIKPLWVFVGLNSVPLGLLLYCKILFFNMQSTFGLLTEFLIFMVLFFLYQGTMVSDEWYVLFLLISLAHRVKRRKVSWESSGCGSFLLHFWVLCWH